MYARILVFKLYFVTLKSQAISYLLENIVIFLYYAFTFWEIHGILFTSYPYLLS